MRLVETLYWEKLHQRPSLKVLCASTPLTFTLDGVFQRFCVFRQGVECGKGTARAAKACEMHGARQSPLCETGDLKQHHLVRELENKSVSGIMSTFGAQYYEVRMLLFRHGLR